MADGATTVEIGHRTEELPRMTGPSSRRFRMTPTELFAAIALVAGGIGWLTNIAVTTGQLSNRFQNVEDSVRKANEGAEKTRDALTDVRERLIKIETLLQAKNENSPK